MYDDTDALDMLLRELPDGGRVLSAEEEQALGARIAAGDTDALDTLIRHNLRLVVGVAKRFQGRGLDMADLFQEGCIGMIRAATKFDHTRGRKFSTYATWWIRQSCSRATLERGRAIRLPVHMGERARRVYATQARLVRETGDVPTLEALGRACNLSLPQLTTALVAGQAVDSLDAPVASLRHGDPMLRGDAIAADAPDAADVAAARDAAARLRAAMAHELEERERRVLELRFGLGAERPHTLDECGQAFGITRERARQIEAEAIAKLRVKAHRYGLVGAL